MAEANSEYIVYIHLIILFFLNLQWYVYVAENHFKFLNVTRMVLFYQMTGFLWYNDLKAVTDLPPFVTSFYRMLTFQTEICSYRTSDLLSIWAFTARNIIIYLLRWDYFIPMVHHLYNYFRSLICNDILQKYYIFAE